MKSSKLQAPSSRETPSSNLQKTGTRILVLGVWSFSGAWMLVLGAFFLSGCSFAPKYARPPVRTPTAFKELTPSDFKETDGWKTAEPQDDAIRGPWWEMFGDSQLNALEEEVNVSNQSIAAAFANFLAARAVVKEARSQFFPTVTASPSVRRSRQSSSGNQSSAS